MVARLPGARLVDLRALGVGKARHRGPLAACPGHCSPRAAIAKAAHLGAPRPEEADPLHRQGLEGHPGVEAGPSPAVASAGVAVGARSEELSS